MVRPAALLEAHDPEPGLGQVTHGHSAAGARSDDEHVGRSPPSRRDVEGKGLHLPVRCRRGGWQLVDGAPLDDGVEQPVPQVVLGLVRKRRALALARIADALAHLQVHVVGAGDDLRERTERVRLLRVQPARLLGRLTPVGAVEQLGRGSAAGPAARERLVEPLALGSAVLAKASRRPPG